jgi:Transglycosylase SLT domain
MPTPELIALARAAAANHALDSALSASSQEGLPGPRQGEPGRIVCTGTALVCAIIEQESAWNPHAIRYEPGFRTRYVAPLGLPPTEEIARSISWGLMQVMGQVAREHGFTGKFLSALCDPVVGLDIGCAALASKIAIASSSRVGGSAGLQAREKPVELSQGFSPGAPPPTAVTVEGLERQGQGTALSEIAHALALWNGGSNPNYAAEVLARVPRYK